MIKEELVYFMVCIPDDKGPKFESLSKSGEVHYASANRSVCKVRKISYVNCETRSGSKKKDNRRRWITGNQNCN